MHPFLEELNKKQLIENITNLDKVNEALFAGKGVYIGFDPSAKSIHLGNFVVVNVLQMALKHKVPVVALIGGATGGIGDPSGKKSERVLLDEKQLAINLAGIQKQISHFLKGATIVNNAKFYEGKSFMDFLRDTGKYIQVPYMLSKDIVKSRLESGISFTEFAYTLIQANDFFLLYHDYNIGIQMGGGDQWGNITTGLELIRKKVGEVSAGGIAIKLFLKADGTKFGKSEKGAVYLDPTWTTPYKMYQFLINQVDADLLKLLNYLSNFSIEEINKIIIEHNKNPKLKYGQKQLAKNLVTRIHGKEAFINVENISKILFETEDLTKLTAQDVEMIVNSFDSFKFDFKVGEKISDLLVKANVFNSKTEVRNLINQNGLKIGNEKISNIDEVLKIENLIHNTIFVKQGKQTYFIITK